MKRIIKCVLSSAILASMMTCSLAFNSFAASKPNPDPNGDGIASIADAVLISTYIHGSCDVLNPSELDINNDNVVSQIDVVAMQRCISLMPY